MTSYTNRYQVMFESLRSKSRMAYIPFVVACDPDFETSEKIISTLIGSGADALEIGFPFSDPVADGPAIQQANTRALGNSATIQSSFKLLAKVRQNNPIIPIGLLVYANLVMAQGIDCFYQQAREVGIDSILIGDCPLQEREMFEGSAAKHGIQSVYVVPPDADTVTIAQAAKASQGYIYLLGRKGVTGTEIEVAEVSTDVISVLKACDSAPIVQGFGVSRPEHVESARRAGVDGVITGSAIISLINEAIHVEKEEHDLLAEISNYARTMSLAACNR